MNRWIKPLGLLAALLLLAACDRNGAVAVGPTQEAQTLRAYTVPPERVETVRVALSNVLGKHGTISLAPPDKLLVLTSAPLQTAIAENLGSLIEANPKAEAPADPGPVRLTLWVVDVTDSVAADPRLQPLETTLDTIKSKLHAPGFALYSLASVTASPDGKRTAQSGDDQTQLVVILSATDGGVNAQFEVRAGRMRLDTQTRLSFGETVVLAQGTPNDNGQSRVRLILVRADPAS